MSAPTTDMPCTKCREGNLICEWKTLIQSLATEYGEEWYANDWVQVVSQSCECVFEVEELDEICGRARDIMSKAIKEKVSIEDAWVTDDM